jgi:gamma-glutamyl-gamma-aminobutyrate hydrolase PuuD
VEKSGYYIDMWAFISQRNIVWDYGSRCDLLENSYIRYLEENGINVVPIPNVTNNVNHYVDDHPKVKAVILSGGNDISPSEYGKKPVGGMSVSQERDRVERKLLECAIRKRMPVLGICRGMQFINVFFGGGLELNLKSIKEVGESHVNCKHFIDIIEKKAEPFFQKKRVEVNSFHDQAVTLENLSTQLKPFAVSLDSKVVEGLFHPQYPIAGVQFHPERGGAEEFNALILKAFIERKGFWG